MTQQFDMYALDIGGRREEVLSSFTALVGRENLERTAQRFEYETGNDQFATFTSWDELRGWLLRSDEEAVLFLEEGADYGSHVLGFGADDSVTYGILTGEMRLDDALELFARLIEQTNADVGLLADICTPPIGRAEFVEVMEGRHFVEFRRNILD